MSRRRALSDAGLDRGDTSRRGVRAAFHSRPILLLAFAFAVMADPVSSVAYAIEAALRALHGDLGLCAGDGARRGDHRAGDHQLPPAGPGSPRAAGRRGGRQSVGEGWAFVPIGALIVDFVLTIAISVAAGASA